MIVSFTAEKIKRIFSVSVAQVKCEYRRLRDSEFRASYILRMNFIAAFASFLGPGRKKKKREITLFAFFYY